LVVTSKRWRARWHPAPWVEKDVVMFLRSFQVSRVGLMLWVGALGCSLGCSNDKNADPARPRRDAGRTVESIASPEGGTRVDAGRSDAGPARMNGADAANLAASPDAATTVAAVDAGQAALDASEPDARVTPVEQSRASWLIQSGDAVFFVGNSFFDTYDRNLPKWVAGVGRAVAPAIEIETGQHLVPGNQPLRWFLEQKESRDAIASGKFDVFVLQPEEREPVDHNAEFEQAVRDYHRAVTAQGGTIMLFMTWELVEEQGSDFFEKLATAYDKIGRELDVPVIPVGRIYDDCNKDPYPGERPYFLTGQELHQTEKGTAVNAYATFGMLTGIDPMGRSFDAPGNDNSPALLKYLSDKTWARVAPRLMLRD
jgi:hypothetical protein